MNGAKYNLDNLVVIVDRNGVQLAGETRDIMDVDIEAVWKALSWEVLVVPKGNDAASVLEALEKMKNSASGKPRVIIANTVKGRGISFMENSLGWHARPMEREHYEKAVSELENG